MKSKVIAWLMGTIIVMTMQVALAHPASFENLGTVELDDVIKVETTTGKDGRIAYILRAKEGDVWRNLYITSDCRPARKELPTEVLLQQIVDEKSKGIKVLERENEKKIHLPQGYDAAAAVFRSDAKSSVVDCGVILAQGRLESRELSWMCVDGDVSYWKPTIRKIVEALRIP